MADFQLELTTTPSAADIATVRAGMRRYEVSLSTVRIIRQSTDRPHHPTST